MADWSGHLGMAAPEEVTRATEIPIPGYKTRTAYESPEIEQDNAPLEEWLGRLMSVDEQINELMNKRWSIYQQINQRIQDNHAAIDKVQTAFIEKMNRPAPAPF